MKLHLITSAARQAAPRLVPKPTDFNRQINCLLSTGGTCSVVPLDHKAVYCTSMRIIRIKLSGFKSFVDPTTLTLPGNLTGVVGPNGCGKSNIIDALIWVMGESSAKHLRGDSMSDVIFNGSNTRKPVGQATVEIIFDNTDGTIGGEYAGFGEISINRTVGRDGLSTYYLNGARCRRKDVTNVFLGTGIGARGYSVIEQGMISRVIEARPEELRAFLEEAAGISKYKERRRETENRMRRTNENIDRLNDIREELAKQLAHLQRQARAAERYQSLKAEERHAEARLLAVRWRALDGDRDQCKRLAEQRANELEERVTGLREIEARQTAVRETQSDATEKFNEVQTEFYAKSADISRLEQAMKHAEEREQSLEKDLTHARASLDEISRALNADVAELDTTKDKLRQVDPRFAERKDSEAHTYEAVRAVEARMDQWQRDWDAFNAEHTTLAQAEHAQQIRLEHLLEDVADADTRASFLSDQASRNKTEDLTAQLDKMRAEMGYAEEQRAQTATERNALRANLSQSRGAAQALGTALHQHQTLLEEQRGRLASLQALQEAAYGGDQDKVEAWFTAQGISELTRLAEYVDIERGWERALEAALRIPLGAICGPDLVKRLLDADSGPADVAPVTVIEPNASAAAHSNAAADTLASKVTSPIDLTPLLAGVFIAENERAAQSLRQRIAAHEIVVTADGTMFGHNWMQLPGSGKESKGILARERVIAELTAQVEKHDADTANLRAQYESANLHLKALEQREHELSQNLELADQGISEQRSAVIQLEAEYERRQARASDVGEELERLAQESADDRESIEQLERDRDRATTALSEHANRREELSAVRNKVQRDLDVSRQRWREERELTHKLELELESLKSNQATLLGAVDRNSAAKAQMAARCEEITSAIASTRMPRSEMRDQLERALAERLDAENRLSKARLDLGELDEELQNSAAQRLEIEQAIAERQQRLEQVRLDHRALEVRLQELMDRFGNTGEDFTAISSTLSAEDSEQTVQHELDRAANRIARLGPINLAAIDEYSQLSERKDYLDKQHDDLTEALETLREAIRKIDRETRTRFKETFDQVNNGLQSMFPVLFGGGHAYLEMTGDDLLETGVTVMARPPGKRNSNIHLLSGGEKALTALAFVFAIFGLNPAPFCLLDEVDAPLDDANIVRLTDMLISMSKSIQFLFVTHNKITMEIAEQLIGVTMQEAGVSRLVSVNMEEAVELAATA